MASYLARAEVYYEEGDSTSCGYISYLLWGGKAAKRWAESKLKEELMSELEKEFSPKVQD
jgi:Na+/H+ antiporter NhaC